MNSVVSNTDAFVEERVRPPPPPPPPPPPEEVLALQQLAITGGSSNLLGMLSVSMLALGGLLTVGSRRNRKDD
ncbi:MAG: hypothetical protein QNK99_09135 [Burkholderiales bacterium]